MWLKNWFFLWVQNKQTEMKSHDACRSKLKKILKIELNLFGLRVYTGEYEVPKWCSFVN